MTLGKLVPSKLAAMVKLMQEHLSRAGMSISLEVSKDLDTVQFIFPMTTTFT